MGTPGHTKMKNTTKYVALGIGTLLLAIGCEADDDDAPTSNERVADTVEWERITLEPEAVDAQIPPGTKVGAIKHRTLDGQEFTFVKHVDDHGNTEALVLDADGEVIPAAEVPTPAPRRIGRSLKAKLDTPASQPEHIASGEMVEVVIGLVDELPPIDEPMSHGGATIDEHGKAEVTVGSVTATDTDVARDLAAREARIDAELARRLAARRARLRKLETRHPTFAGHPAIQAAIERGDASVTVSLRKDEIEAFARDNDDLVAGIELHEVPVDTLGAAMLDTNIDPWALDYAGRQGGGIGVYMSESGCPNAGHITSYMKLSGASTDHSMNVSAIIRGVSPESWVYCRSGFQLPAAADILGYGGNPRIHIETHSWGNGGSDNDDFLLSDRDFDTHVYDSVIAVFNSAGNYGTGNGYVSSPAKAVNSVSVGNYDDSNDTIRNTSSFLDSEIGNEKPELSAPGTSICAGGFCMTGTSMASPHAAGFAADLLGAFAWLRLRPSYLKALMIAGSDKVVAGGLDKVGVGGLNFYRAYFNGTNWWYEGANNVYSGYDAGDYLPNNGYIDQQVNLSSALTSVRIAISWLNRGTYTYDHRADAHPLGMDLDLCVYDPAGVLKGCSSSFDDPYELVSFDPTVSGNYRIRIQRFSNNDAASKFHMGLAVDWN